MEDAPRGRVRLLWALLALALVALLADAWLVNRRPELRPGDAETLAGTLRQGP